MRERILVESNYISTGSTILNCRLTGNPFCGWKKGTINNIIGDSFAGKTLLLWTGFAEASNDPECGIYSIYYDNPESTFGIDIKKHFGRKAFNRVIRAGRNDNFDNSSSIEEFGRNLPNVWNKKNPAIYGLDSYDAIDCEEENKKEVGKRDYPSKPRILTQILRRNVDAIEETKSILFIISQQRQKLDAVQFGSKKRRSGGEALRYYSEVEMWLAVLKSITKEFKKKKEEIGNIVRAKISKNKTTGRKGYGEFAIILNYGIDDILSQINFLTSYGEWSKSKGIIRTPWGKFNQMELIKHIEEKGMERKLKLVTWDLWKKIEKYLTTNRKRKYD